MKANILLGDLKTKQKNVDWLIAELLTVGVEISRSTVYKKLRGESEFNAVEIKGICKIMNYSESEMLDIFFEELVS